jgi:ABC-type glycerol-3-phosphate transport system substrate-binding protein
LPQPGLLAHYARAGQLVPLAADTARLVRQEYTPVWQSLATVNGRLYGVWFKAANKSLLWYDLSAFERAGIAPPTDLDRLFTTARSMQALGIAPFSVGGADQWVLDDWFANLYLQLAGPARYDRLAAHRMPWTDPTVAATLRVMARLLSPANLRGGLTGALHLSFEDSVGGAFTNPPRTAMVYEGDFVAGMLAGHARIGVDVDAAPFPEATTRTVMGGGDVAVQLRRAPAAAALMRYLAEPESAAIWARAGGFLSPNQELDLADYPNPLTRSIARSLLEAGDGFRFGLADLQPAAFGSTPGAGLQGLLHDFLISGDVAATQHRLEAAAMAAYAGPP